MSAASNVGTAIPSQPSVAAIRQPSTSARWIELGTRYAAIVILALVLIVSTFANDHFWDLDNIRNIATQNAPIAFIAIGLTFVIIAGVFDLSVGAMLAGGSVVYAQLAGDMGLWPAALLTMVVGGIAGGVNGLVVTRLRVNPFIGTIGTGAVFTGLVYIACDSSPVEVSKPGFDTLGLGQVAGIPWPFILVMALLLAGSFVLHRTVFGRYIFAVGGNGEAARLAGIPVRFIRWATYVIVGVLAVVAGIVTSSQLSVGQPTLGATTGLDAFAIVVIGGTSVYGGVGALWRTGTGVLTIAVLNNLFNSLAWDGSRQSVAKGLVLVGAVALDALRRRGQP